MEQIKIGVYQIRNLVNNKVYVGSSINLKERWRRHKKDLRKEKHHSIILQRAWNKYGEKSFVFEVLKECEEQNLRDFETELLISLEPVYNICKEAYSTKGRLYKEETREKHKKYARENNVKPPKETYEGRYIPVVKIDKLTGEEIQTYKCLSDACILNGKTSDWVSMISSVCRGKRKTALGFKWKFK